MHSVEVDDLDDLSDTAFMFALSAEAEKASHATNNLKLSSDDRAAVSRQIPADLAHTPPEVHSMSELFYPMGISALESDESVVMQVLLDTGSMCSVFPLKHLPKEAKIMALRKKLSVHCAAFGQAVISHYVALMVQPNALRPAVQISFHVADCDFPIVCKADMSRLGFDISAPALAEPTPNQGPVFVKTPTVVPLELAEEYKREKLMKAVEPGLKVNSGIKGACTNEFGLYCLNLDRRDIRANAPQIPMESEVEEAVEEVIEKWKTNEVVRQVKAPSNICMNIIPVRQPDKIRPCLNPTVLNDHILPHPYDMKLSVQDMLRTAAKGKYISHLDLKDAFHSCPVDEESSKYLVFRFKNKFYQFLRAPFGLADLPAHFSQLMNVIFGDMRRSSSTSMI